MRLTTVINVGLETFAESVRAQGVEVVDVDFRPSPYDAPRLAFTKSGADIEAANAEVVRRIASGKAVLIGLGIARDVIPGMCDQMILHAGPPIGWDRMCGPVRGAVIGACLYEGWAQSPDDAAQLAASGALTFEPCHHHHAVGPMAGIISPSMPVWIIENAAFNNRAFCTLNEGLGKVLRFGAFAPEVIEKLKWMETTLYPALDRAVRSMDGGVDIKNLIAQALYMGDECHNRNKAGTSLFLRALAPALARTCDDRETIARVIEFIDRNDHFFLNLSMPAAKALTEPAEGIEGSTIVTTMGEADANPDMGDSTITETAGFGGMAMAGAPAIVKFVGGVPQDALDATLEMYDICASEHDTFLIPALNFRGAPLGIDVRRVVETGIAPRLNTGIAHKEPGIGQVGAGLLRAPIECFVEAFEEMRGA